MLRLLLVLAGRLPQRARRLLIALSGAGVGLYACATADAMQYGKIGDAVVGAALLALFVVAGAALLSLRRSTAGRRPG